MGDARPRSRSRSPRPKSKSKHSSGFRWKEKRERDQEQEQAQGTDRGLERGYRHDRDGYRDRDRRADDADAERRDKDSHRDRERRRRDKKDTKDAASEAPQDEDDEIARKFGVPSSSLTKAPSNTNVASPALPDNPAKKSKPKVAPPTGPMIVVKVNDRLGTTSKIPCLASDTVGDFKKLVAMQIGRKPHEIMLKRQSERPFKDFLTLEDYGVSDGVQLDLELDTGD